MSALVRNTHGSLSGASGGSFAVNASGGDMLLVAILNTTSSSITGVTFNGAAMTLVANYGQTWVYRLEFPTQGTYNVTVSTSGGTGFIEAEAVVISGGSQYLSASGTVSGTGFSATLTTRIVGDFMLMVGKHSASISDGTAGMVNLFNNSSWGRVSYRLATTTPTDTISMASSGGAYSAVSVGDVPDTVFDVTGIIGLP
jgi:hypothetical protein